MPDAQDSNAQRDKLNGPANPIWVPGLGAFVLLDYRTGFDPDHLEHSVVFLPEDFDTLHDLMARPQEFFNKVLSSYSEVKGYNAGTGAADIAVSQWPLAGPVTIHIEPLTSPSFQNLAMLQALSTLYPGFANLGSLPRGGTLDESIGSFRNAVIAAAQTGANPTQMAAAGAQYDAWVAGLQVREKPDGSNPRDPEPPAHHGRTNAVVSGTMHGRTAQIPPRIPVPTLPTTFALQYVVEFALDTRLVTVRYIPRHVQYPSVISSSDLAHFTHSVTPVTRNPVKYMGFEFLHFDIDMSGATDYHAEMAERRADFAMDFIKNPNSLGAILGNVAPASGQPPYMLMTDQLTQTGNPLHQKFGGPTSQPPIAWPMNRDPVIILESVRPDPSQDWSSVGAPANIQPLGDNDPTNPTPCVIVVYVNGVPVYIVVKNYN